MKQSHKTTALARRNASARRHVVPLWCKLLLMTTLLYDMKSFLNICYAFISDDLSLQDIYLPSYRMIKTDGLTLKDQVHFDRRSYRVLGERFGSTTMELLPKGDSRQ